LAPGVFAYLIRKVSLYQAISLGVVLTLNRLTKVMYESPFVGINVVDPCLVTYKTFSTVIDKLGK
jgi:hypothetical protein